MAPAAMADAVSDNNSSSQTPQAEIKPVSADASPAILSSGTSAAAANVIQTPLAAAQASAALSTTETNPNEIISQKTDQGREASGYVRLTNGYRTDDFRAQISGDPQGQNPNIALQADYKDTQTYLVGAEAEMVTSQSYVFKCSGDYGWMSAGTGRESNYTGDAHYGETLRLDSDVSGDRVFDGSIGFGYQLKPTKNLKVTPLIGYSFHDQEFRLEGSRASVGTGPEPFPSDPQYRARWRGPWIGGDINYLIGKNWSVYSNLAYHWGTYEAEARYTLWDDLREPWRSTDKADMMGMTYAFGLRYAYDRRWAVTLSADFGNWMTHSGTHSEFYGGGEFDTQLKEVDWDTTAIMIGISCNFDPGDPDYEKPQDSVPAKKTKLEDLVKMSGKYRMAGGMNSFGEIIPNKANADLQERNWRYLYGERLENTYDPEIFDQYLLNVDYAPMDKMNIYTQIVADPWSVVGTTGTQTIYNTDGTSYFRPNFKYFGAFNGVLNEVYRANTGDSVNTPPIKVVDGHTTAFTTEGFFTPFIPVYHSTEYDIDYEFRPVRKLWMDYNEDDWHARAFVLADESQALSTDDPIGLSNHRDYWQQSPWLYQYQPIQYFTDGSVKRGYYSDSLSFNARDSEGNRLVLLRGFSYEANLDKTYISTTVAAPFTPWDPKYFTADNIPGAVRIKHWTTEKLMVGGTYTYRTGLINDSITDFSQAVGVDFKNRVNEHVNILGEIAGSHREEDQMTDPTVRTAKQGYAYKAEVNAAFDHKYDGHSDFALTFTQMDSDFDPVLSRFTNTRDDRFWGQHLSFQQFSPELEYFRLGDGIDTNRFTFRAQWKEKLFKDRFFNLFDVRNVHRTENSAYKETVLRDEVTYKINPKLTAKGFFRWQGLPKSTAGQEPFVSSFYVADVVDPQFQNLEVQEGKDPSRFTYSGGLQYLFNKQWTAEGVYEYSNNLTDFPRALMNDSFRDHNDQVDGLLIDHVTNFLYGQGALDALPPYKYYHIFKERLIYKPSETVKFTFHSTQNGYQFSGGIDDNINHQGLSVEWNLLRKWTFFFDYTHSMQIDVPRLISSNYTESVYGDHHNVYASADYRINPSTVFRAEYGVFGMGTNTPLVSPYSTAAFSLPTIDTEHLVRVSLTGDF